MNDCIQARIVWYSSDSCFYFVEDGFGTNAYMEQDKLERLRSMRAKINWKLKKQRRSFYRDFTELLVGWLGQLPDLREIFRGVEIDWLLQEAVRNREKTQHNYRGRLFIRFVARSQYKHVPWLDREGRPNLRRTTALHRIDPSSTMCDAVHDLFQIYDRHDLNYVDSHGYTHFHVACRFNLHVKVGHFLRLGQDPNQLVPRTGDSPLHLAFQGIEGVDQRNYESAVRLLRRGDIDPNVANAEGSTPMQIIFKNNEMSKAKTFLKYCRTINIDDRDGMGRTPLQWAVANLNPRMVDLVLDHGAVLSNFVFPTESYFARGKRGMSSFDNRLHCAMQAIEVVRRLESKGYELSLSDALTIMEFITELRLFEVTRGRREHWNDDEDFARRAKRIQIIPELLVDWNDQLPNLKEIFRGIEIGWLLQEAVRNREKTQHNYRGRLFIRFVARSQYKHVPWLDHEDRPKLRRTTALHRIDPSSTMCDAVHDLFQIYDRHDLNYVDSRGYTHFHVACRFNLHVKVGHFLRLGQDPNQLVPRTGDSPLHLAFQGIEGVDQRNYESAILLLRRGNIDPNVANAEGSTPLQWAVANHLPDMVDLLLNRGAKLSQLRFPHRELLRQGIQRSVVVG
ncbi:unnamed protein product [Trichogramma brassicae]|uniref:Ankyrin n=1 Tax=Trichogramma brassicae TaxID=86971 RepID=A0A6H5HXF6_9HYME|nr:unnamed protein product [Trichogramma brassicae]